MHLSWDQMRQLYISPLILLHNLTMDLFDAAISCSVRLFQHKPPKSLIVKGLLQFQKSFFCYIYQPSRRRGVFNHIIRAKQGPSLEFSLHGLASDSPLPRSPARFLSERASWPSESFTTNSRLCSMSLALGIRFHCL